MAILTLTINTPVPPHDMRHSEVAFIAYALQLAADEIRRDQGNSTTGSIVGTTLAGPGSSLGSWIYTPAARLP